MSRSTKRVAGIPVQTRWRGWRAVFAHMWNTEKTADAFPPKGYGIGWTLNFGYPLIRSKPLYKRIFVFVLGVLTLIVVLWLILILGTLIYYTLTPPEVPVLVIG